MKDHYKLHVEITEEVKNIISKQKVIFPSYYGQVYLKIAKKHGIELTPSELLHKEMIDEKVVRHIVSLTEYTEEAIDAMQTKDQDKLQSILNETKKLHAEIEKLQALVYEDSLTKCYNRKWFEDKLLEDDKVSLYKDGTLVFVDLNRLKRINDDYGHIVGDKVIKYLAIKLKEISSNVVRLGGDEFILIFDKDEIGIEDKMQKSYEFFRKTKLRAEKIEFKATFAYGLCTFKKGDLLSTVMDKADKKMYKFKEGNRA
jgi:diguanylate cyclase (GGDEF)-like protein